MTSSNRIRADFSRLRAVDIASLCGVDARTVTRWVGQGVPRNDDGSFDAASVFKWRINRAEARGEADQRQRLARAQADRIERENQLAAGDLLSLSNSISLWQGILLDARNQLLALPQKVSPRLAHQPVEVIARTLREEVHQTLTDLAEGRSENGLEHLQSR